MSVPRIAREELAARIDAGADLTIVEALGPTYYADAHLPGACNLPHDRVDELASDVLPNKHEFVVVYCANTPCPNSDITARRLVELGYTNVHEYVEESKTGLRPGCRSNPTSRRSERLAGTGELARAHPLGRAPM